MTREELKTHCEKQIEMCEFWAIGKGEKPSGKIYEEHKLILELLEQETILDKVRAEIAEIQLIGYATVDGKREIASRAVMQIIDKYIAEREDKE